MERFPPIRLDIQQRLRHGLVIPAHPLALAPDGALDETAQCRLTRYYHAAGAGGVAVGVHTTQFRIRDPQINLLRPVLRLAAETIRTLDKDTGRTSVRIAGICGRTPQAVREAELAVELDYHAGLLSLGALAEATEDALIAHCRDVAGVIPLFGFYLQPAAGGRLLTESFWRRFLEIPNVVGIKVAPFNRYQTLDVLHAVAASGRAGDVAMYTGNDDHIVEDLVATFCEAHPERGARIPFVGGLLGHWAVWTRRAVELLERCRQARESGTVHDDLLSLGLRITRANAALFDAANGFKGCIPGIQYVLNQQGLIASPRTLDPNETLSPGQAEALDRIQREDPSLTDHEFVKSFLQSQPD